MVTGLETSGINRGRKVTYTQDVRQGTSCNFEGGREVERVR